MANEKYYKRSIPCKIDQWILLKDYEGFIDHGFRFLIATNEPLRDYSLVVETTQIWWGIKKIHNYLKRLPKCSSLFQLHICVKQDILHILKTNQQIARLNEADRRNQLSSIKPDTKETRM